MKKVIIAASVLGVLLVACKEKDTTVEVPATENTAQEDNEVEDVLGDEEEGVDLEAIVDEAEEEFESLEQESEELEDALNELDNL